MGRLEITVKYERVLRVAEGRRLYAWCAVCGGEAEVVTPEEAALLLGVSSRTVYRRVEAGEFHSSETAEGLLRVCLDSIIGRKRWGPAAPS